MKVQKIGDALDILIQLGLPEAQQNERTALTLLALLNLTPELSWTDASAPMIGITPIINFIDQHYGRRYAPNTRETIRKQSVQTFVLAGLVLSNPDNPARGPNSPKTVYQVEDMALALLRTYGSNEWERRLERYTALRPSLVERFRQERNLHRVPVQVATNTTITLSPGAHSNLISAIIEHFAPRFVHGSSLLYVGDTGRKWGYFDETVFTKLGVHLDSHGKMPDVVLYYPAKNWLLLIEAVTSSGAIDGKRREELAHLFSQASADLVYITAFPNRNTMTRFIKTIAWETEVWIADNPSHLIHFDGEKFLGPYNAK